MTKKTYHQKPLRTAYNMQQNGFFTDSYFPIQRQKLQFYPCTGEYGSLKTCILAYFMQC